MSRICTEGEFKNLVARYPYLCAAGLMTQEYSQQFNIFFDASRKAILSDYRGFFLATDWFSKCRLANAASESSPKSAFLAEKLSSYLKAAITNGALIASVLYSEIPYYRTPGSVNLYVGISKFCPSYLALVRVKSPGAIQKKPSM